ncbi:MAG TPA: helix-turn-helix domain-containing protein [Ramlibacter sp.]|nr:helix-turn-helix domain-containing protein [Ramlibacter sp.]
MDASPPCSFATDCGAALRRAREAAGWSQRELARRAGVHQPQVARAESGQDVQLSLLARLAAPLGLEPGLLVAGPRPGSVPAPTPAASLHDTVSESVDGWRAAWPEVDPEVFAVQARMLRAGRHVKQGIDHIASLHGLSSGEVVVLGALRRSGPPFESTPTALKHRLWISLPGLKKRLDRLHERGLITRTENPRDGRGLVVRMTKQGKATVDEMVAHSPEPIWHALTQMPPADLAQLSYLLRTFLGRLEAHPEDSGETLMQRRPRSMMLNLDK